MAVSLIDGAPSARSGQSASAAAGPGEPGSYMRRAPLAQHRVDDAPRLEHAVLAREQRRVAVQRRADQPLVGADFVVARVAD